MFMNRYSELIYEQSFHSTAVLCFSYNNENVYGRKKEQIITISLERPNKNVTLFCKKKWRFIIFFPL